MNNYTEIMNIYTEIKEMVLVNLIETEHIPIDFVEDIRTICCNNNMNSDWLDFAVAEAITEYNFLKGGEF